MGKISDAIRDFEEQYDDLEERYADLEKQHEELLEEYKTLDLKYEDLEVNYAKTLEAFMALQDYLDENHEGITTAYKVSIRMEE